MIPNRSVNESRRATQPRLVTEREISTEVGPEPGFGYLDLDKTGAKLLFQVFTERKERRAIAVASNAPFSEWKQTFTDPRLCSAIVDRVTFNAHIIETGTDSFRLAQTQEKRRRRT
ncbi:ATP-binding protein [Streptomyces sp. NPDC026672]|uniref:ATP-binding protein n=1 Tax=unclassified Streptomyces TaxID=2593676 RepID=UPI0033EF0E29